MNEYESVKQYLKGLEKALKGLDPALIADALDDAEEHLELAVEEYIKSGKVESTQEALEAAIKEYGLPSDIAEEYMRLEPEKPIVPKKRSLFYQIFGVYSERQTYLNLIYLLLQFPLGFIYFLYIVPAVLLILALFITLVGIPLGILFLISIFGLSWFHGRMSEAFLGMRMPQKRRKLITGGTYERMRTHKDVTDFGRFTSSPTWQKVENILKDVRLYTSTAYLFLTFPLGIIYFVIFVALFSSTATLIVPPIDTFQPLLTELFEGTWAHFGLSQFGTTTYTFTYPIFGFILLTATLHLSNILARLHGRMTKALLVKR